MHTVERLEQALRLADALGFTVRQEWLGGATAGACELQGRRWLFVDLALSPSEQLEQVLDALDSIASTQAVADHPELRQVLQARKAA